MKQESPSENLFHYLHWRGDLSFAQAPFCPVDNLIFCCLSYLNWGIPASSSTPETAISLKDAAAYWEHLPESLQQTRVPLDLPGSEQHSFWFCSLISLCGILSGAAGTAILCNDVSIR